MCHEKAGKTPPIPRTGRSENAELVRWCPMTTRHMIKRCSDGCKTDVNRGGAIHEQPRGDGTKVPTGVEKGSVEGARVPTLSVWKTRDALR